MKMVNFVPPWRYDFFPISPRASPIFWRSPPMVLRDSFRSHIVQWIARTVADRMNNNFSVCRLVENVVWIGRGGDAPNGRVVGHRASQRVPQEQVGDCANSGVDAGSSLRGAISDVVQNRCKIGERRKRIT